MIELHEAVQSGDESEIKRIIQSGHDINQLDSSGKSPLFYAVNQNTFSLNFPGNKEETSLKITKLLVEFGCDINFLSSDGYPPIYNAVEAKNIPVIIYLLENGSNSNFIDKNDKSLIEYAVETNDGEIVNALLDFTSLWYRINKEGNTPLHLACINNSIICIKKFIDKVDVKKIINIKNYADYTCLLLAIKNSNRELVQLLIKVGCDVNLGGPSNLTPLMLVCSKGCYKDANYVSNLKCFYCLMINDLLEANADIKLMNDAGFTALHYADYCEAKLLINESAEINARSRNGLIPLHCAAKRQSFNTVKFLLERGGDPNLKDNNGWNCLHYALHDNYYSSLPDIVKLLLLFGANPNSRDNKGIIPLYYAFTTFPSFNKAYTFGDGIHRDYREHCIKILLSFSSDLSITLKNGLKLPQYMYNRFYNDGCEGISIIKFVLSTAFLYASNSDLKDPYLNQFTCSLLNSQSNELKYNFFIECSKEIILLKKYKIFNTSYHNLITQNISNFINYIQDKRISVELDSKNYKLLFPIYAEILEIKYLFASCFTESYFKIDLVTLFFTCLFEHFNYPKLNSLTIEYIGKFLSIEDICNLFRCMRDVMKDEIESILNNFNCSFLTVLTTSTCDIPLEISYLLHNCLQ